MKMLLGYGVVIFLDPPHITTIFSLQKFAKGSTPYSNNIFTIDIIWRGVHLKSEGDRERRGGGEKEKGEGKKEGEKGEGEGARRRERKETERERKKEVGREVGGKKSLNHTVR